MGSNISSINKKELENNICRDYIYSSYDEIIKLRQIIKENEKNNDYYLTENNIFLKLFYDKIFSLFNDGMNIFNVSYIDAYYYLLQKKNKNNIILDPQIFHFMKLNVRQKYDNKTDQSQYIIKNFNKKMEIFFSNENEFNFVLIPYVNKYIKLLQMIITMKTNIKYDNKINDKEIINFLLEENNFLTGYKIIENNKKGYSIFLTSNIKLNILIQQYDLSLFLNTTDTNEFKKNDNIFILKAKNIPIIYNVSNINNYLFIDPYKSITNLFLYNNLSFILIDSFYIYFKDNIIFQQTINNIIQYDITTHTNEDFNKLLNIINEKDIIYFIFI